MISELLPRRRVGPETGLPNTSPISIVTLRHLFQTLSEYYSALLKAYFPFWLVRVHETNVLNILRQICFEMIRARPSVGGGQRACISFLIMYLYV